ncbi:hypothetical protein [Leptospira kirschneri]|uniref:hypothetical protein n=1 Tax=Leptospira kirschneri TaxID=29507 RepID=UPI0002E7C831|nr:hypothetical protein [Leptospira kirschneri]
MWNSRGQRTEAAGLSFGKQEQGSSALRIESAGSERIFLKMDTIEANDEICIKKI